MADINNFFGTSLGTPLGVDKYSVTLPGGEIIFFANNLMKVAIYGSLIVALINLLIAGIQFISSSGNPEFIKAASAKIWISLLGLVVAGGSLVIAGILGLILFGNATAIINPQIYGP